MLRIAWFDLRRNYTPRTRRSQVGTFSVKSDILTSRMICGLFFLSVLQVRTVSVRSDLHARSAFRLVIFFLSVIGCDSCTRSTSKLFIRFDPLVRPSGSVILSVDRLSLLIETLVDYQVKSTGTPGTLTHTSVLYVCPSQRIYSGYRRYQAWPPVLAG